MSADTTSTSNREEADAHPQGPAKETSGAPAWASTPAGLASLLDPSVIAKMANELFAALPGTPVAPAGSLSSLSPQARAAGEPAAVATGAPQTAPLDRSAQTNSLGSQSYPMAAAAILPANPGAVPTLGAPGTPFGAFSGARPTFLNAAPVFPAPGELVSLPSVPGAHSPPLPVPFAVDPARPSLPTTLLPTEASSRASDSPPTRQISPVSEFAHEVPSAPTSSSNLRQANETGPFNAALLFPAIGDVFTFPLVSGVQSVPGSTAVPSPAQPGAPAEADMRTIVASLPGATQATGTIADNVSTGLLPGSPDHAVAEKVMALPSATGAFEFRPELIPDLGVSKRPFDPNVIRADFPILQERVNGRRLVWLDNAATTQKPNAVIDRLSSFYRHENSNVHRASHTLSARATDAYEGAREKVRRFLNAASSREIVFVRGTTEGINLVAQSWGRRHVGKGDEVVITWLEHHSNIVPWQQLCAEKGACLKVAPVDDRGQIIMEQYEKLLGPRTRIVAFSHVSNALGTITPAREMVEMAHRHGARVLVDGAQSVAHMREDVQALDCDFFVFSGHKIFAPTGIGVVYGKVDILDNTPPWQGGGSMIADVTFEKTVYHQAPKRFEAGTPNIADAAGLGAALDYLSEIGLEVIARYEHELLNYATAALKTVPGLHIIGTAAEKAGAISFVLEGIAAEDVGTALNQEGIALRAGHHCAQPILRRFGLEATVRPSLALYNTRDDVDALIAALLRIRSARGDHGKL